MRKPDRTSLIRSLVRVHDLIMAAVAFPAAMVLRVGTAAFDLPQMLAMASIVFIVICAVVFPLSGLNRGSWRYASMEDLIAIARASFIAIIATVLALFIINRLGGMPRSVPVIAWFVVVSLLSASRIVYRVARSGSIGQLIGLLPAGSGRPVLLYGYGDEADLFIQSMQQSRRSSFHVVGIIDRRVRHKGRLLHGVPVIGSLADIPTFLERRRGRRIAPEGIVIARKRLSRRHIAEIVDQALAHNFRVYRLPDFVDVHAETGSAIPDPHPIEIEDVLGRSINALELRDISELLQGRTVLITGAGGTIGSELARQVSACRPCRIVLFENSEFSLYTIEQDLRERFPSLSLRAVIGDVRDETRVNEIMEQEGIETVFHAAALKQVPLVEENPLQGVLTNVFGTRNVADAALSNGCRAFVLISTDKAVNPCNVMGATKRVAEAYCQSLDLKSPTTRFVTVRFGNVLASAGSVVPLFQRQIAKGGPVTVTDPEISRYFMTIKEAVHLVLQAASQGFVGGEERGKIHVLEMGKPVKIVDLARQMILLAGRKPDEDIEITYTGLRPGEKLHEELFDPAEEVQPTSNRRLMMASPRAVDLAVLERSMDELRAAADRRDRRRAIEMLRHIVPEFAPVGDNDQSEQPPIGTTAD